MKPNEAIENIDNILSSPILCDESIEYQLTTDDIDCLEMAKEVLEKQIPIKPVERFPFNYCPKCERSVFNTKYCPDCGQALDWSDKE